MEFFFTGVWGFLYLVTLIIAGYVTIRGRNTDERRILYALIANWLATRTFVVIGAADSYYFAADVLTMIALVVFGKTDATKVSALLYFGIVSVGMAFDAGLIAYSSVTVWWDVLSFAIMLIMAGAANDFWSGKRIRLTDIWRYRTASGPSVLAVRNNPTDGDSVGSGKD